MYYTPGKSRAVIQRSEKPFISKSVFLVFTAIVRFKMDYSTTLHSVLLKFSRFLGVKVTKQKFDFQVYGMT